MAVGADRRIPDLKDPAQQAEWRRCQKLVEKEAALVRSMARAGRSTSTPGVMPCHRSTSDSAVRDAGADLRSFPVALVRLQPTAIQLSIAAVERSACCRVWVSVATVSSRLVARRVSHACNRLQAPEPEPRPPHGDDARTVPRHEPYIQVLTVRTKLRVKQLEPSRGLRPHTRDMRHTPGADPRQGSLANI